MPSTNRLIIKRNIFCAYCAIPFTNSRNTEDEHVIGRRFVPKGTLAGQWNLILQSCPKCNDHKAELENDLSAITMQPNAAGRFAADDPCLRSEAFRKGQTRNQRTQRRVSEPENPLVIKGNIGKNQISISLKSPAQADTVRIFELAKLQLIGFFSLLTYDETQKRGFFWTGKYFPIVIARKEDWGNPQLQWINDVSTSWEHRLHGITANGFYKIWIRRRLEEPAIWAWVMEWNKAFRIAGFFGDINAIHELLKGLPELNCSRFLDEEKSLYEMREEIPLAEKDDILFVPLHEKRQFRK